MLFSRYYDVERLNNGWTMGLFAHSFATFLSKKAHKNHLKSRLRLNPEHWNASYIMLRWLLTKVPEVFVLTELDLKLVNKSIKSCQLHFQYHVFLIIKVHVTGTICALTSAYLFLTFLRNILQMNQFSAALYFLNYNFSVY